MNASYEHKHKIEVTRQKEHYYKFYNLIKYKRINSKIILIKKQLQISFQSIK